MKKSVFLRLFTMLLAFAILLCLTACQSGENPGDTESYDSSIDPSIFLNTEDETTVSQKSEYVQKEFHISTFQGLAPVEEVTDMTPEYYTNAAKAHKEAGFTLIENAFLNRQAGLIAARACESAKIHFLHQNITYDMGFSGVGSSTPGVYEDTVEAVVQEMKDYKYLEGYYTWDEVDKTTLELCKNVNDLFTKHDSKRLPFAITYPSYGRYRWDNQNDPDESSFARYVRSFDETVNPPVLCFDYYPFQMHGGENTDLMVCDVWRDIGLFRSLSLETGKPFWFYFQGYNMGTHTPSHNYYFSNEMRSVQMYYAIAYGAKSVSYFITAGGVLVDEYGNKSAEFEDIKKLNQRVKNLGDFLFEKTSEEILHFGLEDAWLEPYYLDSVADSKLIADAPDGTIVATFGDKSNKKYVLVVNKDYRNAVSGQLRLETTKKVSAYDHVTNKTAKASKTATISLDIPAGECKLYIVE